MTGPDPYPGRIGVALREARRAGLAFPEAWARAIEKYPPPREWKRRMEAGCDWLQGSTDAQERETPLAFAKHHFARAYARIDLKGDVSFLADERRPIVAHAAREPVVRTGCRWGGRGCDVVAIEGGRFCVGHTAELAAMRKSLGDEAQERLNNGRLPKRAPVLLYSRDAAPGELARGRATVLG